VVRLCRVRGDSAGNVSWSSVPDAGVVEQFKGTLDPSGLRGLITWVEEASARVTSKVSVDLQPVSANDLSAPEVSGLYSNLHYIQRSGDLTGRDVLILGLGPRPKILITRYEGAPQGPFVVESLRVSGDTLSGIYRMARVQHFTFIRRGGELHTLDGGVLQRRAGLLDALRPKPQPPC